MKQKKNKGFTLLEMMIVVGIVGVLSSLAIPGYGKYIRKARRGEAIAEMNNMMTIIQKRYASTNNNTVTSSYLLYKSSTYYDYYTYYYNYYGQYTYWAAIAQAKAGTSQYNDTERNNNGSTYSCMYLEIYSDDYRYPLTCFNE